MQPLPNYFGLMLNANTVDLLMLFAASHVCRKLVCLHLHRLLTAVTPDLHILVFQLY